MGIYLNPNNIDFKRAINSEIYVDKSMMIEETNRHLFTEQQYICVSRPRRFGKSMAANMLTAYYSRGCDSRELFSGLKISQSESFGKHLNRYNVIHLNMVNYLAESKNMEEMLAFIREDLCEELLNEWDCIFRIHKNNTEAQTKYLDFLRNLLKDQSYVALAYMTGILPIKKYGEHSALNIFTEVSMTNPREYAEFTGFTKEEVKALCERYDMSFKETKRWYNGYNLKGISIYNPRSVVMSMSGHDFDNYWTSTETYEALKVYIEMNFDGLRDTIIRLLAGEKAVIDTTTFCNDMVTFHDKDDVLTLLLHLGYLTYDFFTKEVWIPNYEISQQFASTIKIMGWSEVCVIKEINKS